MTRKTVFQFHRLSIDEHVFGARWRAVRGRRLLLTLLCISALAHLCTCNHLPASIWRSMFCRSAAVDRGTTPGSEKLVLSNCANVMSRSAAAINGSAGETFSQRNGALKVTR
jgi:hypothetical protein